MYTKKYIADAQMQYNIAHYSSVINAYSFNDPKHLPKEAPVIETEREAAERKKKTNISLGGLRERLIAISKSK